MTKSTLRNGIYGIAALIVLFGPEANAQGVVPEGPLDINFLFRFLLAGLIGILIWIAKGTDTRLSKVEKRIEEFNVISAERQSTIEHNILRIVAMEHEQKQLATMISMQRETMLTKYLDKEETERHRFKVEDSLAKHAEILNAISHRLDMMARPFHRAEDDVGRG